jgi:hypothetical protein
VIIFRGVGVGWALVESLQMLADGARARGDLETAGSLLDDALAVAQEIRGPWTRGLASQGLGRLARARDDLGEAQSHHREALQAFVEMGHKLAAVEAMESLAGLAARTDRFEKAVCLFGAVEAIREAIGSVRFASEESSYQADLALARTGLADEAFDRAWSTGRAMSLDEAAAFALTGPDAS